MEGRNPIHDEIPREGLTRKPNAMNVTINGDRREIPDGLTVSALLDHLGMLSDRVAIERNRDILPRVQWNETNVQPQDNFEIVHFVGGG
jgi:thiamine biosynthesis protein ThiS